MKQTEILYSEYENIPKEDLIKTLNAIEYDIYNNKMLLDEENNKFEKFKVKE